jgi:hypothetical protein
MAANKYTYQVLRDTNTEAIIKLTGVFDGTGGQEANGSRITANSFSFALDANGAPLRSGLSVSNTALSYYDLQLTGLKYYVNFPTNTVGGVEVYWNGAGSSQAAQYANSATIFHLNMQGEFGLGEQLPSILNNSGNTAYGAVGSAGFNASVGNGDIGVTSTGATGNSAYTLIISLRKNNLMYSRGQFQEPAAFNYKPYNITP